MTEGTTPVAESGVNVAFDCEVIGDASLRKAADEYLRLMSKPVKVSAPVLASAPPPPVVVAAPPPPVVPVGGEARLLRSLLVAAPTHPMRDGNTAVRGRRGCLLEGSEVAVDCEVFYTSSCEGRVDLSVRSRTHAVIRAGQLRCVNPDRVGLTLQPLPVTEKPDDGGVTHSIRFQLVELCDKAPEVHAELKLQEHSYELRPHKLFFRLPVVLPLFLQPRPTQPEAWAELWGRREMYSVAKSLELPQDLATSQRLLLDVLTLGGQLTVVSTMVPPNSSLLIRVAGTLPTHGCMTSSPIMLLEVNARFSSDEATLVELRVDVNPVLARRLMDWFLWLLQPLRLPPLPDAA